MEITRTTLVNGLQSALEASSSVHAAWLGGSSATGREDGWSDIDLYVVCDDGAVEETIRTVEHALEAIAPIERRYRVPEPAWHGHSQVFFQQKGLPPWLMTDTLLIQRSTSNWFLEPERHGHAVVLFDREGIVEERPLDRVAHEAAVRSRRQDVIARFPVFQHLVTKAIRRANPAEAVAFYHALTLRPLVDLLRITHCADRFDYGMRYLFDDLPQTVFARINDLSFTSSLADLERKHLEAGEWFLELAGLTSAGVRRS